jgi:hypothetical protein
LPISIGHKKKELGSPGFDAVLGFGCAGIGSGEHHPYITGNTPYTTRGY